MSARATNSPSFGGLICLHHRDHLLLYLQRSRFVTPQHSLLQFELSPDLYRAGQGIQEGHVRDMAAESDHTQINMQPQISPFHELGHLVVTHPQTPPQSKGAKLQRPLHKVRGREQLQSHYRADALMGPELIMGQSSWRDKYEIQDLFLPLRNNDVSDPFGTPLSKSAINAFRASLESVCIQS